MGQPKALPCTPRGIMVLLEEYQIPVAGKNVVIIGRSNLVGRPLAAFNDKCRCYGHCGT